MSIKNIQVVCFSPTGTTTTVTEAIVNGIGIKEINWLDLTKAENREQELVVDSNSLLIVAVPVYMGRVPALLEKWFEKLISFDTKAVCVLVYGNRTYGNAMLELRNILSERGCFVIAGGAFVGEHSFSTMEVPLSEGRPADNDLVIAENFGVEISTKISNNILTTINLPGEYPYGGVTKLWSVDFIDVNNSCCNKKVCVEICPTGAINPDNTKEIDIEKCISCCACIKSCPEGARFKKESRVTEASIRLFDNCKEPKKPEYYV